MATTAPFFLRPRTVYREIDTTQTLQADVSSFGYVGGEFERGPLKPRYTSGSLDKFRRLYGSVSNPQVSYAHDTASLFLDESANLLVQRVVNGALYSATDVFFDVDETYGSRLVYVPHAIGSMYDFETGSEHMSGVTFLKFGGTDKNFVVANDFSMDISDGASVSAVTASWAGNHRSTMNAIASAIQTVLAGFGSGGTATVYQEPSSVNDPSYTIIIKSPKDALLTYSNPAVINGVTQPTATVLDSDTNWFGTIVAENPGVWGSDIGVKINAFDPGQRERFKLTFSDSLITGNNFSISVNSTAVTALFNTDSDQTMADIATALKANAHISDAYVETVAGTTDNDRSIVVVAEVAGEGQLILQDYQVTGGATQAAISVAQTLDGYPSNGSFAIEVYERSNPFFPTERYLVTSFAQLDGRGQEMHYASLINNDSIGSDNIRVVLNPNILDEAAFRSTVLTRVSQADFQIPETIFYMGGGDDGSTVLTSNMVASLANIEDRTRYPVAILMNAGYTQVAYQQALTRLAENRNDCFAILDMPSAVQENATAARDYRLYDLNINSSHAAIYTPDVLISDVSTGERRYVPPSGHMGAVFVYTDKVANRWSAPAGVNRGGIKRALGLRAYYAPADEELLFPNGVNYLLDKPAYGIVAWTQETLQVDNSALSSIHIRRLLSMVSTTITDGLDQIFHENNDEFTRFNATQMAESVLSPVHRRRGFYGYFIRCDERNNTAEVIDADALAMDVYVKPVRSIKGVLLNMIITRTGVEFSEIENVLFPQSDLQN